MKVRLKKRVFWLEELPIGSVIDLPREMVEKMVITGQVERIVSKDAKGKFVKKVKDETSTPDKGKNE